MQEDKKVSYKSKEDGRTLISTELHDSIGSHNKGFDDYRDLRRESIKLFCGDWYNKASRTEKAMVNYIDQVIVIYESLLAPTLPHCEMTSNIENGGPVAADLGLAINEIARKGKLVTEINKALVDALFCMGIVKVGLCLTDYVDGIARGNSFAKRISMDNYFCDLIANDRSEMQFEGDDYYVSADWAKENYDYVCKTPTDEYAVSEDGNDQTNQARDTQSLKQYKPRVQLRDVFLPQERRFLTYSIKDRVILSDNKWDPEFSPYKILGFRWVPDNIIPLSPIAVIFTLAKKCNELLLKCYAQGNWQKNITTFPNSDKKAASDFKKALDGDAISATGNAKATTVGTSGVQQPTFMLALKMADLVSESAGGLQSLGGLGPEAETAKQEGIVNKSANMKVQNMSQKTEEFVQEIFEAIAYFTYDDPDLDLDLQKPILDTKMTIPIKWNLDRAEGDYEDWHFDFEIVAEPDNSSNGKLKRLLGVMNEVILPSAQLIVDSGGQLDAEEYFGLISEWSNLPELKRIITFNGQPMQEAQGANGTPAIKAPAGDHVYTHKSAQGANQKSKDMAFMMEAAGKESQPSEKAKMF